MRILPIITRFSVPLSVAVIAICAVSALCTDSMRQGRVVVKEQGFLPFANAPIHYRSANLDDPIARLERRLEAGQTVLTYDERFGYLRSVLDQLHVPVSSQTLVFSKTSFQFPQITPATPRALYFNDDVYVGRVHQGKFLEFVSFDAQQGAIFYVLDESRSDHPRFERAAVDCVQCHVADSTRGVPGVMLRSVFTKPSGYQAGGTKSFITGQESPFEERWGGWYVTALRAPHLGMANTTVASSAQAQQGAAPRSSAPVSSLADRLNTERYLTGSSDIVALMVLAHQTQMHNLITQTNYQTRLALSSEETRNRAAGTPAETLSEAARAQFEAPAEQLVRYLLFTNESALQSPIAGNTTFTEDFAARGPYDAHGRSLRQFDLKTRIFKYPCSYLIYSEDFDAIPEPAKTYVYRRLFEVLSGRDTSSDFSRLSASDRRAILEILIDTKPNLPAEWKSLFESAGNHHKRVLVAATQH
jgi:hypothetical protein